MKALTKRIKKRSKEESNILSIGEYQAILEKLETDKQYEKSAYKAEIGDVIYKNIFTTEAVDSAKNGDTEFTVRKLENWDEYDPHSIFRSKDYEEDMIFKSAMNTINDSLSPKFSMVLEDDKAVFTYEED